MRGSKRFFYFSTVIFILLVLLAIVYPFYFSEGGVIAIEKRLLYPSLKHPFGTDALGRDLLYQISLGLRTSFFIGFTALLLSAVIGLIMGGIAGIGGRITDVVVMRIVEIFQSFPGFLLALTFAAFSSASTFHIILALSLMGWASFARFVRGEIIRLKEKQFIDSAYALGASTFRMFFRHILPSFFPHFLVQSSFTLGGFILAESSLSFLGLGGETESIGRMIAEGIEFILSYPYLCIFPGMVFSLVVLSINLIGEYLSDWARKSSSV